MMMDHSECSIMECSHVGACWYEFKFRGTNRHAKLWVCESCMAAIITYNRLKDEEEAARA